MLWIFAFLTTIPLKECVSCAPTIHCRYFAQYYDMYAYIKEI